MGYSGGTTAGRRLERMKTLPLVLLSLVGLALLVAQTPPASAQASPALALRVPGAPGANSEASDNSAREDATASPSVHAR